MDNEQPAEITLPASPLAKALLRYIDLQAETETLLDENPDLVKLLASIKNGGYLSAWGRLLPGANSTLPKSLTS